MKRRILFVALSALTLGASIGICSHFAIESQANAIMVKAEDSQAVLDSQANELTPEEQSKLQEIIDELHKKYNEVKDVQVFGTTIGAIAGALVGAIVSAIPALLNRKNIRSALDMVGLCKGYVDNVGKMAKEMGEKFDATNEKFDKAIGKIEGLGKELEALQTALEQTEASYAVLKAENEDLKDLIVIMANHTKELVANGTAEIINQKFKK